MSRLFKPTEYNNETKNQLWLSTIGDTHDMICGCDTPFAHLLDNIFPIGHTDREKKISFIIDRDYKACHFGGDEETNHGIPLGGSAATEPVPEEENIKEEEEDNLDALLAAAAATVEENTR